ncbi:unnamed protein product, partial [Polarella glacialis]
MTDLEDVELEDIVGTLPTEANEAAEVQGSDVSANQKNTAELDQQPAVKSLLLVMICIVQAYATTNGPLRHKFKVALNIQDSGAVSEVFTQAAVFVQYGKFAMTLGQNILLGSISPKLRVWLSMALVCLGALVIPLVVYTFGCKGLWTVFVAYGMIGLGLGIFECTFLSVITPLGKLTKAWAIMGFPAAFGIINIVMMTFVSVGLPVSAVFWYVFASIPIGALVFGFRAPVDAQHTAKKSEFEQVTFRESMLDWRSWTLKLIPLALANCISHFVMENVGPAAFDTFNGPQ